MMLSHLLLLSLLGFSGDAGDAPLESMVVAADVLHVGDGRVVENALITVSDGKIRSVTSGAPPDGAVYVESAVVTPGLVDAYSLMGVGSESTEQSRETTPSYRIAYAADLDSPAFGRALRQGVTAACLSPDSLNVIGGLAAVVKTHGGQPADLFAEEGGAARVLLDGAALKLALGGETSFRNRPPRFNPPRDVYFRRPTTRMGGVWLVRREFYRAKRYKELRDAGRVEADPDMDVLVAVMDGRLPVRVLARRSHDVQTALRLREEFGWDHLIIEEGQEAHLAAALLQAEGVPVVTGPAFDTVSRAVARGPSLAELRAQADPPPICCEHLDHEHELLGDYAFEDEDDALEVRGVALDVLLLTLPRYAAAGASLGRPRESSHATPALAALLNEAGVAFALGAAEAHDTPASEASLIQQARLAVSYGLDPAVAIACVTGRAAELCFAQERLGTVQPGKDADLVVWSGDPLATDSHPVLVIVDGRIVFDVRESS